MSEPVRQKRNFGMDPWRVEESKYDDKVKYWYVMDGDSVMGGGSVIFQTYNPHIARLVAAVPELVDVLELVCEFFSDPKNMNFVEPMDVKPILEAAVKATRKITGEKEREA
jgi:hypothetical protein